MRYTFTVPGRAVPAARMTQRSKWSDRAQRSLSYQREVAYAALGARLPCPLPWDRVGIAIRVYLKGVRERKNSPLRLPRNGGDWDNYGKVLCDGIQYAGVLANDRAISFGQVRLVVCETAAEERAEVELWEEAEA